MKRFFGYFAASVAVVAIAGFIVFAIGVVVRIGILVWIDWHKTPETTMWGDLIVVSVVLVACAIAFLVVVGMIREDRQAALKGKSMKPRRIARAIKTQVNGGISEDDLTELIERVE